LIIEPEVREYAWDDFSKTPELVNAGEVATMKLLPEIRALVRGEKKDSAA